VNLNSSLDLFSLATAKVLHSSLKYSKNSLSLQKIVTEKFLAFMELSLASIKEDDLFEIFCNLIYYFLTDVYLGEAFKLLIINNFFMLDGHRKILQKIFQEKVQSAIELKSLVVMAEIMNVFLTFLSKSIGRESDFKRKSYEITFKGTRKSSAEVTAEESLMYIFEKFVDFMWKKKTFDKCEVLSNTAVIFAASKGKMTIDPTFFFMLLTLHTSTFVDIKVQHNKLLQISANSALRSIKTISEVDLKFLLWWKAMGKPDKKLFNQVSMKFLKKTKLDAIERHEAEIFDKKIILERFLNTKASKTFHGNLKEILCSYSDIGKSSSDFKKLLNEWMRLQAEKGSQKAMNVMDVIVKNVGSVEEIELKKKTAMKFVEFVEKPAASSCEKIAVIEMAASLLRVERIPFDVD
jgi:hypothetical protein